jgi:hypothetical protein
MRTNVRAISIGLTLSLLRAWLSFGQGEPASLPAYDKLPDWSGVWSMMGAVFDRARRPARGAVSAGVIASPTPPSGRPSTKHISSGEIRTSSRHDLQLRRPSRFLATSISPSGEFVVRPEQVRVLTENGPNVLRITPTRKHLEDQ